MKIAVVGGGSTYTPELVDGLARLREQLPVDELALMDPDATRLEAVGGVSRRILTAYGHPAALTTTTDLATAVDGADAVLLQLRVGGQAARERDETWPLDCGCVGQETTGAGGLAKAMRTVPVVLAIADLVRSRNPDAWIVDFTNPVGIVTRALLQQGHRAIGLCNVAIGLQRHLASLTGATPADVVLDHVGLNHLTWVRGVRLGGTGGDVLPRIIEDHAADLAEHLELPERLLRDTGLLPSYYLRYYYAHDEVVEEQRHSPSRARVVADLEATLLDLYRDPAVTTKPALLEQRGGAYYSEAAVDLVGALLGTGATSTPSRQVVNVRNGSTLPLLPEDAVIEVPAIVTARGAEPVPQAPLPPLVAGLVAHVHAYERLALDAALHGGRARVVEALLAHPLVGQLSVADCLADRLIADNRAHLPWAT
ncbi:6-phospho-beta-glucosidase [Monashia sp. NPDC004114]